MAAASEPQILRNLLDLAAALVVALGLAHSFLGERYILQRLLRREDLPRLFGSADFTRRTLRFAWHVTSVAWLGLAAEAGRVPGARRRERTEPLRSSRRNAYAGTT